MHSSHEWRYLATMSIPVIADGNLALFLDVDGTLLEIAETPGAVIVSESLKTLLGELSVRLDGALALVSGRSVQSLDALFAPLRFTAAGVHGCERRETTGCIMRPKIDAVKFASARDELAVWVRQHPGSLLEDKGYALALHYRRAPELETSAQARVVSMLSRMGGDYELQRGKAVFEIRPAGFSKGKAIQTFMQEPPFAGRLPVFIGDDVTDEDGFAIVNALGGLSIRVGQVATSVATAAKYHLADVNEVIAWLRSLPLPARTRSD